MELIGIMGVPVHDDALFERHDYGAKATAQSHNLRIYHVKINFFLYACIYMATFTQA